MVAVAFVPHGATPPPISQHRSPRHTPPLFTWLQSDPQYPVEHAHPPTTEEEPLEIGLPVQLPLPAQR